MTVLAPRPDYDVSDSLSPSGHRFVRDFYFYAKSHASCSILRAFSGRVAPVAEIDGFREYTPRATLTPSARVNGVRVGRWGGPCICLGIEY